MPRGSTQGNGDSMQLGDSMLSTAARSEMVIAR